MPCDSCRLVSSFLLRHRVASLRPVRNLGRARQNIKKFIRTTRHFERKIYRDLYAADDSRLAPNKAAKAILSFQVSASLACHCFGGAVILSRYMYPCITRRWKVKKKESKIVWIGKRRRRATKNKRQLGPLFGFLLCVCICHRLLERFRIAEAVIYSLDSGLG